MASDDEQRVQIPLSQFITLILGTVLVLSLVNFGLTAIESYRLQHEADTLRASIAAEKAENERLQARKEYVASDAYQTQLAHELGLYAADEKRIMVVAPPELKQEQTDTDPIFRTAEIPEPPHWQQWWNVFFD